MSPPEAQTVVGERKCGLRASQQSREGSETQGHCTVSMGSSSKPQLCVGHPRLLEASRQENKLLSKKAMTHASPSPLSVIKCSMNALSIGIDF